MNSPAPPARCPRPNWMLASAWILAACAQPEIASKSSATAALPERPHVVYVFTDDQRWDTLPGVDPENFPQDVFPNVERYLMREGLSFTAAYNSNPLCAPSRGNLLAGGVRSRDTGVLRNQWPNGSALSFDDARSLGPYLQRLGYRTAFLGKYLNGHGELVGQTPTGEPVERRHYIPPGWDIFVHREFTPTWTRHALTLGSSGPDGPESGIWLPPEVDRLDEFVAQLEAAGLPPAISAELARFDPEREIYVTDFERDLALALLNDAAQTDCDPASSRPWFVLIALESPHQPAIPQDVDVGRYAQYRYRGRAFDEQDLSDKPPHVQRAAQRTEEAKPIGPYETADELWQAMLESMRSVDRLVGQIVEMLEASPQLAAKTAVFFSSDNGYLWGEHGLRTKRWPYEESIRAPLCIRMPGLPPGVHEGPVAVDLDLPATFLTLAGADPATLHAVYGCDGVSLLPVLRKPARHIREYAFCESFGLEAFGSNEDDSAWCAVVFEGLKVVLHDYTVAGQPVLELYDLQRDPFELESRHADPAYADALERGLSLIEQERGLAVVDLLDNLGTLPTATRGQPYEHQLRAVGGQAPYRFELFEDSTRPRGNIEGQLVFPPGLALSSDGWIRGSPRDPGTFQFVVRVTDSGHSKQHGGHHTYTRRLRLVIED